VATILKFRPRRTPQPVAVRKPESCACCLGRAGEIYVPDYWFCATCDAFIRAGEIVPASDGRGYQATTPAAEQHLEAGWQMYEEGYIGTPPKTAL
jgi:hypothetical protein